MSILSPADRAVLWRIVLSSDGDERASLRRVLATEILGTIGRRFDLDGGLEEAVIETLRLLDVSGLLGRDDLREAFEEADGDEDRAQAFAAVLAVHLGHVADIERLGVEARMQAVRLAGAWQSHVLDRSQGPPEWLTAPQVAARYGVTPQAVYKWIKAGRVSAEQTPGGSWRLPVGQFERAGRPDRRRLAELKARLVEHVGGAATVSDEELAGEIVGRRRR